MIYRYVLAGAFGALGLLVTSMVFPQHSTKTPMMDNDVDDTSLIRYLRALREGAEKPSKTE